MDASGLWAILWGDAGQFHEVRIGMARCWVPTHQRRAFTRLLNADDCFVSCVPRAHKDDLSWAASHVLWARLEKPACADRLARFRVPPTLVIREFGSNRRTVLWALSRPLEGRWVVTATERLAHHLQGRRTNARPSALIPSPFTRLTLGRQRPCRCFIEYESDSYATPREIVGHLPDAPDLKDWRAAA
jgi:hypothetical protein